MNSHAIYQYENKQANKDKVIILLQDIIEILIKDMMVDGGRWDIEANVFSYDIIMLCLLFQIYLFPTEYWMWSIPPKWWTAMMIIYSHITTHSYLHQMSLGLPSAFLFQIRVHWKNRWLKWTKWYYHPYRSIYVYLNPCKFWFANSDCSSISISFLNICLVLTGMSLYKTYVIIPNQLPVMNWIEWIANLKQGYFCKKLHFGVII